MQKLLFSELITELHITKLTWWNHITTPESMNAIKKEGFKLIRTFDTYGRGVYFSCPALQYMPNLISVALGEVMNIFDFSGVYREVENGSLIQREKLMEMIYANPKTTELFVNAVRNYATNDSDKIYFETLIAKKEYIDLFWPIAHDLFPTLGYDAIMITPNPRWGENEMYCIVYNIEKLNSMLKNPKLVKFGLNKNFIS